MAAFVIDASVASTWCFKDELTDYTDSVLNALSGSVITIAPRLLLYEIHNTTLTGLRRQRIDRADAEAFLQLSYGLPIKIVDPLSYRAIFALALHHGLTVYNAAYLDLALRKGLPIASLDIVLRKAAVNAGLSVYTP